MDADKVKKSETQGRRGSAEGQLGKLCLFFSHILPAMNSSAQSNSSIFYGKIHRSFNSCLFLNNLQHIVHSML